MVGDDGTRSVGADAGGAGAVIIVAFIIVRVVGLVEANKGGKLKFRGDGNGSLIFT
jgi:hypothetical protein